MSESTSNNQYFPEEIMLAFDELTCIEGFTHTGPIRFYQFFKTDDDMHAVHNGLLAAWRSSESIVATFELHLTNDFWGYKYTRGPLEFILFTTLKDNCDASD